MQGCIGLSTHAKDAFLPSNHATGTLSIALGLGRYDNTLSRILSILSLLVGFSRVYVGHHYPLDVIAAYVIVLIVNHVYNLKLRDKVENFYEIAEKKVLEKLGIKALTN